MKNNKIIWLAGFLFLMSCSKQNSQNKFEIQEGQFKASITETGELQAINAISINMPSIGFKYGWKFKIIDLVDNGTIVKRGDQIAKIDQATIRKRIIDLETNYNLEQANLNKQIIEQNNQLRNLEITLNEENANFELKELEVATFKFESPQKRRIKELEFEQVKINKAKAIRNIKRQQIVKENQIKIQKLKVDQIKKDIDGAYIAIKKLDIISPINGIVQLKKNRRTKQNYRIGDEIYLNQSFALVPDINFMKVRTYINELDYNKIKLGQKVDVRLDALPEVVFEGKLSTLGKLSKLKEKDSRIKVFDAEITIINNDERLKPGMTVSCQIFYADYAKAIYVNNNCLLREKGKYYIFPKKGDKQEVKIGYSNNSHTVIIGNHKKGQVLQQANRKKKSRSQYKV